MVSVFRFVIVAGAAATALTLSSLAVVRRVRRVAPKTRAHAITDRIALALGALVVALLAYGHVEPYWPEVVPVRVPLPKLHGSRPIRIVQLSDIHSDKTARLEGSLPGRIAALAPDLIAYTGDSINSEAGLQNLRGLMTELAKIAPTFAVRGNWDVWWFPRANLFGGTGVRELNGEAVKVKVRDDELYVVGIAVDSERRLGTALATVPKGKAVVLLHHFPAAIAVSEPLGVDLQLSGDTHGGQFRIPGVGELIRISRRGIWEPLGLGRHGDTWLYVNRGIGMEGGAPPVRIGSRPEITVLELVRP